MAKDCPRSGHPRIEEDWTTTAITVFLQFFLSILLFQYAPSLGDHSTDMPPVPVGSRSIASQFDAMRKHCLCCRPVPVRPSVRHVGVLYPQHWRYRLNFFLSLAAHHSSFFFTSAPVPNSKGNPSAGTQNTRRWENMWFSVEIATYLETVRDRPMVAVER